ncbi:GAF domain-containing SpoIIE family protein phosphatase [Actinoplanes sp. G11-F43]|uniref:GAF domain-containing SpoIIE family protein phosphatase n=1 Tax=Actinoplanes sp. G11-F43 TaxID=3424130 RepID=UPI003D34E3A1
MHITHWWGIDGDVHRLAALTHTGLEAVADPMFDRFAAMVRTVLGVPVALVSLVGPDRQFFPGQIGLGEPWAARRQTPLSHSFCRHVVATAEPLIVTDARTDPRVRDNLAIEDLGVVGYAGMPVHDADGRVLGSLCAIDHEPRQWSTQETALLADLAAACSDSLQLRIASYHAERQRLAGRFLLDASVALGAAATAAEVADIVRGLVIGSLDPAHVEVDRTASGRTPAGVAVRTGRIVVLPDLAAVAETAPDALAVFTEAKWQSAVSVPLPGSTGAVTFCWTGVHRPAEAEQAVLTGLAGYVAQALQRIDRYEDRRTAAETMQKALLSPLPPVDHLRIEARYLPAGRGDLVGGDWYDAVRLDDSRLAVVIGDVAGHGVTAAATMGHYRSMLRTLLVDRYDYPSALLHRFERAARVLGVGGMATAVVAYLTAEETGGHTLTWANAGHVPPTLILPGDGPRSLPTGGPLLGGLRGVARRTHTQWLPPGSRLLLYTDGLIETRTCPLDDGIACLHQLLADHPSAALGELADRAIAITPDEHRQDDTSLVVIETFSS